jgi:ABC-type branched-subunit amino acid transport system ATPase component
MTSALRCCAINKSFGGVEALTNVSVAFPDRAVTAIIGPNGAGKSTLIDVITGFTKPDSGACYFGDVPITHWPSDRIARQGIARTFQNVRFAREVSVVENLQLAAATLAEEAMLFPKKIDRTTAAQREDEARGWLELAGLDRVGDRKAGELSYGQQKMLTLICCLCTGRTTLILDEPIAGIHPDLAQKVVTLLRTISGEGRRLVIIEHDIETVRAVADHVVVMDAGRLITEGATKAVLEDPAVMEAYLG